jgi:hypothetical protein
MKTRWNQKLNQKVQSIVENAREKLFSGFLAFLSILLGVFTFSLVESFKYKGLPMGLPWNVLSITSGLSIMASGIISLVMFYYGGRPVPLVWSMIIIFLFTAVLLTCSIGVPFIGWWMYNYRM